MKRRSFIMLLGGAATWPIVARGQHSSRALPKFESYAAFETATFFGSKSKAAIERFHGIGRLVLPLSALSMDHRQRPTPHMCRHSSADLQSPDRY
jgi:hypothetical protein